MGFVIIEMKHMTRIVSMIGWIKGKILVFFVK